MRRERLQRLAPTLAVVLVGLLAGLSLGSGLLVLRHFKADATATSRLYSGVFGGLNDPRPGGDRLPFGKLITRADDEPPVVQTRIRAASRFPQAEQRKRAPAGSGRKGTSRCDLWRQR